MFVWRKMFYDSYICQFCCNYNMRLELIYCCKTKKELIYASSYIFTNKLKLCYKYTKQRTTGAWKCISQTDYNLSTIFLLAHFSGGDNLCMFILNFVTHCPFNIYDLKCVGFSRFYQHSSAPASHSAISAYAYKSNFACFIPRQSPGIFSMARVRRRKKFGSLGW